jgi:hypothetical protein
MGPWYLPTLRPLEWLQRSASVVKRVNRMNVERCTDGIEQAVRYGASRGVDVRIIPVH